MKIRFLSTQQPRTGRPEGDPIYEAGKVYDLRDDIARWWLGQQVAVRADAPDPPPAEKAEAPAEDRALRGTDLDDPGTDAPRPDAMTTADIQRPTKVGGSESDDGLEAMTRDELLELAEKEGVELPSGYQRKDDIIAALRSAKGS